MEAELYRLGDWELNPKDRLLKRGSQAAPLSPKAFDALLCLVRRGGGLVTKTELTDTLWPTTYVSEASLTNLIGSLRKTLGRDAIRTVSKHGYRLTLPVRGEPGISPELYARFLRAKELSVQRSSADSVEHACELYWVCLAENPNFAPAWAWLGRTAYFLAKFGRRNGAYLEMAHASFRRAFTLDPDLACAHQFYTPIQADTGQAADALHRLLQRLTREPSEPETYAGLVHVFRYLGLLQESIDADARAHQLDPSLMTSIAHTLFSKADYAAAIDTYARRGGAYLDAAAWAALGEKPRAITLLRDRLQRQVFSGVMAPLMQSLLELLQGDHDAAVQIMNAAHIRHDPESQFYFARHYAHAGAVDKAVEAIRQAAAEGYTCSPEALDADRWLEPLRSHKEFRSLRNDAAARVAQARANVRLPL